MNRRSPRDGDVLGREEQEDPSKDIGARNEELTEEWDERDEGVAGRNDDLDERRALHHVEKEGRLEREQDPAVVGPERPTSPTEVPDRHRRRKRQIKPSNGDEDVGKQVADEGCRRAALHRDNRAGRGRRGNGGGHGRGGRQEATEIFRYGIRWVLKERAADLRSKGRPTEVNGERRGEVGRRLKRAPGFLWMGGGNMIEPELLSRLMPCPLPSDEGEREWGRGWQIRGLCSGWQAGQLKGGRLGARPRAGDARRSRSQSRQSDDGRPLARISQDRALSRLGTCGQWVRL